MSEELNARQCTGCGAEIPAEAPHGLCPKCLLEGVTAQTESVQTPGNALEAPSIERVAQAFPQLEIVELVGQGGMGFVYKARQPKLDRYVALKILPDRLAEDAAFRERFEREGRVLASLNHPSIVTVFDFGEAGGFFYLMMEYIDGVNLRQAMSAGRFTPQEALAVVPGICDALQFAHSEGVLHRDIKPANILMDSKGRVKIADFGIAKIVGEPKRGSTLTASGYTLGTPHYMAPEQIEKPTDVDHRADIYSLGVVFYELLTGELPIGRFALPSDKSPVTDSVDEIVLRALAKERERRQQSAEEMKSEVKQASEVGAVREAPKRKPGEEPKGEALLGARCHFSTPERLRTLKGRTSAPFSGSGEARLFENCLSLVENDRRLTIPLGSIRDVSLGYFNWWAQKGEKIPFVSLTQDVNGVGHTITLTLREQWIEPLTDTCRLTAQWTEEIRKAVKARAGREPAVTPEKTVSVTNAPYWILNAIIAAILFIPLFGFFGAEVVKGGESHKELGVILLGVGLTLASLGAAVAAVMAAIAFAHTRRAVDIGNLRALTERHSRSDVSPAPGADVGPEGTRVIRKWSKAVIVGAVCNGLALLPAALLMVFVVMMAPDPSWNPAWAELITVIGALAFWGALALAGQILGVVGVRNIDASRGRLRSRELAMWCAWFWPVVAPVLIAFGLSTRGVSGAFILLLLALCGAGLVGLWHLTKGSRSESARSEPNTNSKVVLVAAAIGVLIAILAGILASSGSVGFGEVLVVVFLAILGLSALAGVGALVGNLSSPKRSGEGNPWPRRLFLLLLGVVVIPPALLLVAWLVPALAYQGARAVGPSPAALEIVEQTARVKVDKLMFQDGSLQFDYAFEGAPGLRGWVVVRTWSGGGETGRPERFEGETTSALNEQGTKVLNLGQRLRIDKSAALQAMVGLRNADGRGKNLKLGQTYGLLDITNDEGKRLTVALEMRPKPIASAGRPGYQIYVRAMDVRLEEGYAELKYEVVQSVEGYELLLESAAASPSAVHPDGRRVELPEPDVADDTQLHRLGDRSWRTLRWKFPAEHANDATQVSMVTQSRLWEVDMDSSPTLFEIRNESRGRLHSARLLMVPVETKDSASAKPSAQSGVGLGWLEGTWVLDEERSGPVKLSQSELEELTREVIADLRAEGDSPFGGLAAEELQAMLGEHFPLTKDNLDQLQNGFTLEGLRGLRLTFARDGVTSVSPMLGTFSHEYDEVAALDADTIRVRFNGEEGGCYRRISEDLMKVLNAPEEDGWNLVLRRIPAKRAGGPMKAIEFDPVYVLNQQALAFRTKSPFPAGESLRSYLVRGDGRTEEQASEHTLSGFPATTEMDTSGFWSFYKECSGEVVTNAGGQFRAKLKGNVLEAPYNARVRVFSVTNLHGAILHGELEVLKPKPDVVAAAAGAHVQTHSATLSGGNGIMLFLTSDLPDGCRLIAKGVAPEGVKGKVQISMSRKNPFDDGSVVWRWGEALDGAALTNALRQLERFKGDNPVEVSVGEAAEVFSVTNATGKVFKGLLELVGPAQPSAGVETAPPPPGENVAGEKDIRFPGGATVRVRLEKKAKDNSRTRLAEDLVFKLPDEIYGSLKLKWVGRPSGGDGHGGSWALVVEQGHDGFEIHRFSGEFDSPVALSTPYDGDPDSLLSKPAELYDPGRMTHIDFLHVSEKRDAGEPVRTWWKFIANVQHVSPREKSVVPAFKVPKPATDGN